MIQPNKEPNTNMEPLFKAKSLKDGEWAVGYYAHQHLPIFGDDHRYMYHQDVHSIFCDKVSDNVSSYWTHINVDTLCQMTPMTDALGAPIWEHDRVRIYQLTRKSPSMPLHHMEGEVVMLSSCYAVVTDDGRQHPIVNLRKNYDLLVTGNAFDTPKPTPQTTDKQTADHTDTNCEPHEDGLRCADNRKAE